MDIHTKNLSLSRGPYCNQMCEINEYLSTCKKYVMHQPEKVEVSGHSSLRPYSLPKKPRQVYRNQERLLNGCFTVYINISIYTHIILILLSLTKQM